MTDDSFVKFLLRRGYATLDQICEAESRVSMGEPSDDRSPMSDALVELGYCTGSQVAQGLADVHSMEYFDLDSVEIPDEVLESVPETTARENNVLPIRVEAGGDNDDCLVLAIADPTRVDLMDSIRFILNRKVSFVVADALSITEMINQGYRQTEGESMDSVLTEMTATNIDFSYISLDDHDQESRQISGSPAARIVDLMIGEALQTRASDIHVEPFADRVRVRYRIDGSCKLRSDLPKRIHSSVISRIMVLAKMDITNKRAPSDGRIRTQVGDKPMDLRVSIIPTSHGLSCVMRLLNRDTIRVGIKQLGILDKDYLRFHALTRRPSGIVLVVGPTGSGKTTTLYAALKSLNTPSRKIITAEDPVEYNLPGVNQVEVNRDKGVGFSAIIRSMLRQAPHVILVGEIRDRETAEMGIQAAQTGHLVLSTLHSNDAPSAVSRLLDLGVPGYAISSGLSGVLAQRLVRVTCERCKIPHAPKPETAKYCGLTAEQVRDAQFARGKGCSRCENTGFRGRIGIYELMELNAELRDLINREASIVSLRKAAMKSGMMTLFEDGMVKAAMGITTIEEIQRAAVPREFTQTKICEVVS